MFLRILLLLTLLVDLSYGAEQQQKRLGVGGVLGDPTGLTVKYWKSSDRAIDGAIGWSVSGKGTSVSVHSDYLIHKMNLVKIPEGKLPLYYGIGGFVTSGKHSFAGARFPLGAAFLFRTVPGEIFLELAPKMLLIPSSGFRIDAALGGRVYL